MGKTKKDLYFLQQAICLAKKGEGFTSPNPLVGAVITKNNKIIAKGYHKRCGLPHAEIEAIKSAKGDLKGSTLYINLEPCCHFGKTGPCVDEIIKRGIKKVFISTIDPNPKVKGKSIKRLRKEGVKVELGLAKKEALELNEIFFKNMNKKRPFVVAKLAQSLDGKIASSKGISKWITSSQSRKFAKSLRDKYDCVLIGANTLKKDNPKLNGLKKIPYKVVISSKLDLPKSSYIFKNNPEKLIIFTSQKKKLKRKTIPSKARVFYLKEDRGFFSPDEILKKLYKLDIMSVFVEGGSKTLGYFFKKKRVDKVYFFIAPLVLGGSDALCSIGAGGFSSPIKAATIKNIDIKHIGRDFLFSGYPEYR